MPVATLSLVICATFACGGTGEPPLSSAASVDEEVAAAAHGFVFRDDAFEAPPLPSQVPFDVVSADMDLDGDPDVLINWHNLARLELFENRRGSFALRNPEGADASGLFDNPGIPSIYAPLEPMLGRVRQAARPGVYVWHDPSGRLDWHFYVIPDAGPVTIGLRANRPLAVRLAEEDVRRAGEFDADVEIDEPKHFSASVAFVATQLVLNASLPVFVGPGLHPAGPGPVELWKDDPHGIAWLDVAGSPHPDLFLTRGGLMGTLRPPHDPKLDRFFVHGGATTPPPGEVLFQDRRRSIPSGYGRGRRVEWVDIDADAVSELYVGNTDSPNTLLVRTGDEYRDLAPELDLDALQGDTFAWLDVDDDGLDDLVFVAADGFEIAMNRGARRFERMAGEQLGLVFPSGSAPGAAPDPESPLANLSLHVLDVDNDGRLDLWLVGHGAGRGHALYRRTAAGGFVDVTADAGLANAPGANSLVALDLENDGYLDAITAGLEWVALHNNAGQGFELAVLEDPWTLPAYTRGVALDVEGDGRRDLVLIGDRRLVARNVGAGGTGLEVTLRSRRGDPVGAVVRAFYANGMVQAQRFGSAGSTQYSQGALPLHFGIPEGGAIDRLEVRWPGGATASHDVRAGETSIEIAR